MCNLYRMTHPVDEIAGLFDAVRERAANLPGEIYPGYPGLVVVGGDGVRRLQPMTWGFPLALKGAGGRPRKPRPVTNAREDKLLTGFWRPSFEHRRCLVPVSAWAEAEGEKGRMTRTWYALPGGEAFAVAGLWRPTAEWGAAYAMVMCNGCAQMAAVHDRMPVILARPQWDAWLGGAPADAIGLCRTWTGALLVEQTRERWSGRPAPDCAPELPLAG